MAEMVSVKFANYLTDGRNGFTESRFSEQQSRCAETWEIIRFRVKPHRAEKSIGITCEQDIITAILSGFDGNKKKLTQWQDRFWEHMVKKYPDLERGESASETGRDHIPPRLFKEMTRLTKQKAKLEELLSGVNAFNAKGKAVEIGAFLDKYIPAVEQMHTTLKKYNTAFTVTTAENKKLKKKTEQLEQSLDKATQESTLKKLADAKLHRDYEDAVAVLDRIPKEVLAAYTHRTEKERETAYGR